jgi:hypothetical protein
MRIYGCNREPIHDWCIVQKSKNKIVGEEYEALELYPAQSRIMNNENCYHLWILAPNENETEPPQFQVGYDMQPKMLMTKPDFERLSPRRKKGLKDKKALVVFYTDEWLETALREFPDEGAVRALEKYIDVHPEIIGILEKWNPEEL